MKKEQIENLEKGYKIPWEDTAEIKEHQHTKKKLARAIQEAKCFSREQRLEEVKCLANESIKFIKENDVTLFHNEVELFMDLLKAELQFIYGRG